MSPFFVGIVSVKNRYYTNDLLQGYPLCKGTCTIRVSSNSQPLVQKGSPGPKWHKKGGCFTFSKVKPYYFLLQKHQYLDLNEIELFFTLFNV